MLRSSLVLLAAGLAACGGHVSPLSSHLVAPAVSLDRMTVRTAEQQVVVESPIDAGRRVEQMVQDAGGYVERSSGSSDGKMRIVGRVPAAHLDRIMDSVAALGDERRRQVSGTDVTEQYIDLEARLRSQIALRDRLRQLLDRAATLNEVLELERQIARLQAEIDGLQARIEQLKSQVELASLAVSLDHKRVLGPLGLVGHGLAYVVGKLFVIR